MVFDPTKPIYIKTNIFNYTLGACFSQKDDQGCMHPVVFLSWKFSPAELNYQIHDKELMAIITAYKE